MADPGSTDILKPSSYYKTSNRRDTLIQLASVATGAAIGGVLTAPLFMPLEKPQKKAVPPAQPVSDVGTTTLQSQDVVRKPESSLDILLSVHPPFLKQEFRKRISEQIDFYKRRDGKLVKNIQRVNELIQTGIIQDAAKQLGLSLESPVLKLLPGLIFVESKGNPNAKAGDPDASKPEDIPYKDNRAWGLCQLLPSTAKELATQLQQKGIAIDVPPNLYDAKTNVMLGLHYLSYLYSLFPEPAMAVWAYHFGPGNMVKAMDRYLDDTFPQKASEIEIAWKASPTPTPKLIQTKDYQINYMNVVESAGVQDQFEFNKPVEKRKSYLDESEKYATRVGAGLWFLENPDPFSLSDNVQIP